MAASRTSATDDAHRTVWFVCSPHLGLLDNWLPVLDELRRTDIPVRIVMVSPSPRTIEQIVAGDPLVGIADRVFDAVVFRTARGVWRQASTLSTWSSAAHLHRRIQSITEWLTKPTTHRGATLSMRLCGGLAAGLDLAARSRIVRLMLTAWDRLTFRSQRVDLQEAAESVDAVTYCVSSEWNEHCADVLALTRRVPRFSIYHGGVTAGIATQPDQQPLAIEAPLTCLVANADERQSMHHKYGVSPDDCVVVGVPRHAKSWMDRVAEESARSHHVWDSQYVAVISRPIRAGGVPRERKATFFHNVREIAEQLDVGIVVKRHPKELPDGIAEAAFGIDSYGTTWTYSRAHPFHLANAAALSISFGSAVDADMVVCGVPAVDHRDRRGLPQYDRHDARRDDRGDIIEGYATYGVTLVAPRSADLHNVGQQVAADRASLVEDLQSAYRRHFPSPESALHTAVATILASLKG